MVNKQSQRKSKNMCENFVKSLDISEKWYTIELALRKREC